MRGGERVAGAPVLERRGAVARQRLVRDLRGRRVGAGGVCEKCMKERGEVAKMRECARRGRAGGQLAVRTVLRSVGGVSPPSKMGAPDASSPRLTLPPMHAR